MPNRVSVHNTIHEAFDSLEPGLGLGTFAKSCRDTVLLIHLPFPPPINRDISHSELSYAPRKHLDGALPCTGVGSGEGELRLALMAQTATTLICPLALQPLLPPGRAVTVGVEVATITELCADTEDSGSGEGVACGAHAEGQLEHVVKAGNVLGAEAMGPGKLHSASHCANSA